MLYKYISTHEVKDQRSLAKRTSQIKKYGQDDMIQNGKMYYIQNGCSR